MKKFLFLLAVIFLLSPPVLTAPEVTTTDTSAQAQTGTEAAPMRARRAAAPASNSASEAAVTAAAPSSEDATDTESDNPTDTTQNEDQSAPTETETQAATVVEAKAATTDSANSTTQTEEAQNTQNTQATETNQKVLPISAEQSSNPAKIIVNISGGTLNLSDGNALPETVEAGGSLDTMILPSKGCSLPASVSVLENGSDMDASKWGYNSKTGEILIQNVSDGATITIQINCSAAVPAVFKTPLDPDEEVNVHKEVYKSEPVEDDSARVLADTLFREATLHKAYLFAGVGCLLVALVLSGAIRHISKNDKQEELSRQGITIYQREETAV